MESIYYSPAYWHSILDSTILFSNLTEAKGNCGNAMVTRKKKRPKNWGESLRYTIENKNHLNSGSRANLRVRATQTPLAWIHYWMNNSWLSSSILGILQKLALPPRHVLAQAALQPGSILNISFNHSPDLPQESLKCSHT